MPVRPAIAAASNPPTPPGVGEAAARPSLHQLRHRHPGLPAAFSAAAALAALYWCTARPSLAPSGDPPCSRPAVRRPGHPACGCAPWPTCSPTPALIVELRIDTEVQISGPRGKPAGEPSSRKNKMNTSKIIINSRRADSRSTPVSGAFRPAACTPDRRANQASPTCSPSFLSQLKSPGTDLRKSLQSSSPLKPKKTREKPPPTEKRTGSHRTDLRRARQRRAQAPGGLQRPGGKRHL